jgi:dienelactone hydrolase
MFSRICSTLLVAVCLCPQASAQDKLDRDKLLFYLDSAGKAQPVKFVGDWDKRRASILDAMQSVMGPLPGKDRRCPLDVKIDEEVDCESYVRRLISYQSEPGQRVPAYLLIPKHFLDPKSKKKSVPVPGILSLHQTHAKGFLVTVGLGNSPNDEYGVELAKRGYVVIAPPYPLLANYRPDLKKLGYQSGTMKAIWDNMRALDVLDSLPYVLKSHHVAIGHSLGGHNSIYTAAFDDRLKVAVSCCGLDMYRDYMKGKIKGWTSDRYMPKLWDSADKLDQVPFDFGEIVAAIAPRHVLIVAPKGDDNFRWESAAKVAQNAADVYKLLTSEANLRIEHPDCKHVFLPEMREKAYKVMDDVLKR